MFTHQSPAMPSRYSRPSASTTVESLAETMTSWCSSSCLWGTIGWMTLARSCLTTDGRSAVVDMSLSCSRSSRIGRGGRTTGAAARSAAARHRLRRLDVEGGDPAQLAAIPGVVERPRAMHCCAVVPDHQVAHLPEMAVD